MDSPIEEDPQGPSALRGAGPVIFVLSLVCAFLIWSRQRPGMGGPGAPMHTAPALPDRAGVEGWAGTSGSLHARLMPLHSDLERQRFDGRALERRLGLDPGEPWRLLVTYLPRGEAAGPVAISSWSVADADGLALRPIVDGPGPGVESGVTDPLRSLLSAPGQLEPGHEVSLVLWGRAPVQVADDAPHIVGAAGQLAVDGGAWDLEARRFDSSPAQPSLARLDRLSTGPVGRDAVRSSSAAAGPGVRSPR